MCAEAPDDVEALQWSAINGPTSKGERKPTIAIEGLP